MTTQLAESRRGSRRRSLPKATERVLVPLRQLIHISLHPRKDWYALSGGERPAVLWHRTCRHCSLPTMVQQDSAEKCPPGKEKGRSQISLPTALHGWQRGSGQEQQQGEAEAPTVTQGRVPPHLGQWGQAGLWSPVPSLPLTQLSRDTAGP